jgi:putative hydrolase of HD superfamily
MDKLLNFFIRIGGLKNIKRRGLVLIGVEDPASIVDHMFRMSIMCWLLNKKKKEKLDVAKILKMTLAHDLCELFSGDRTPYDYADGLPEDKDKWPELFDKWPRFSKEEKEKMAENKYEAEKEGLVKVVQGLPDEFQKEIKDLWEEYVSGLSREANFVKQVNRLETLLQALEYSEEDNSRPFKSWWIGTKERIDDPVLIEFMDAMEERFTLSDKMDN